MGSSGRRLCTDGVPPPSALQSVNYNDGMFALRYAAVLALVLWIGGLLALGAFVAPAVFDVPAARQVPDNRALSGAIFGEVLRRFYLVSYACGAVVLGTLGARAVLGPRPRPFGIRVGIAATMLATALYSGLVVSHDVERVRTEIGIAPSSLPETDARRQAFDRLHATSTALQLVPLIGGVLLVFWELKE